MDAKARTNPLFHDPDEEEEILLLETAWNRNEGGLVELATKISPMALWGTVIRSLPDTDGTWIKSVLARLA